MAAIELSVKTPEAAVMTAKAESVARLVDATQIVDDETYQAAASLLQIVQKSLKALTDERDRILKPIKEAQQATMQLFKAPIEIRTKARDALRVGMRDYAEEQERKAREAAAAQRALAEAEARRQREAAEAAQRKADERAEQLRREAEAARIAGDKQAAAKVEQRAEAALERAQEKQRAADAAEQAAAAPVAVAAAAPKAAGVSYRTTWKARVIDPALVPREYLIVDEAALAKLATAQKDKASVPGVEFYGERTLVSRTK